VNGTSDPSITQAQRERSVNAIAALNPPSTTYTYTLLTPADGVTSHVGVWTKAYYNYSNGNAGKPRIQDPMWSWLLAPVAGPPPDDVPPEVPPGGGGVTVVAPGLAVRRPRLRLLTDLRARGSQIVDFVPRRHVVSLDLPDPKDITGTTGTLVLDVGSRVVAQLKELQVIEVVQQNGTVEEWRVVDISVAVGGGAGTVTLTLVPPIVFDWPPPRSTHRRPRDVRRQRPLHAGTGVRPRARAPRRDRARALDARPHRPERRQAARRAEHHAARVAAGDLR
jgi:hypothetical protein